MKKTLLAIAVLLIVLIAGGGYWLHGNLDGLVQAAIGQYGSAMTKATVQVDSVKITALDGHGVIDGLLVGNPAGFKTPYAVKAGHIELEVDMSTLAKDVVLIKKIVIREPEVIYEKGEKKTNFDAIQANITAYLGPSTGAPVKKLIVQEFVMRGAKAQASAAFMNGKTVTVAVPDIVLHDLGKAKGGLTPGELGLEITNAVEKRLMGVINFDKLARSVSGVLERAGNAIKGLFK